MNKTYLLLVEDVVLVVEDVVLIIGFAPLETEVSLEFVDL